MTHVGDLGNCLTDQLAKLISLDNEAARSLSDVGSAVTSFKHVLEAGYRTPDIAEGTGGFVVKTREIGQLICEAVTEIADMRHAYHAV